MKKLLLICAATLLFAPAVHAQCAGCDADFNKAERKAAEKEAQEKPLVDALGNGKAKEAHDAQKADYNRTNKQTDEALKDETAPPPK